MIVNITATTPAENIEMKIKETPLYIGGEDRWVDIDDAVDGTVSHAVGFSVPSDLKPGVYIIPIVLRYDSGDRTYKEHFVEVITVTSGKGVEVELPGWIYDGKEQKIKISIKNTGATMYGAVLSVPEAMGDSQIYVGDLESGEGVDKYVEILPECKGGTYTFHLSLRGYRGTNAVEEPLNYTVRCVPLTEDLEVSMEVPQRVGGGEHNTALSITNRTDVAIGPISVKISGVNVRIGGKTSYYFNSISPKGNISIPIVWKLQRSDEAGDIDVVLSSPQGERRYSFSVIPEDAPRISVFTSGKPVWENELLKVTLTVANLGTGTAENIVVETEGAESYGGKEIIGDLAPGDYDTVTVYLANPKGEEEIRSKVEYLMHGQKKMEEFNVGVKVPPKPEGAPLWIAIVVVAAGIWWWRKRR